MVSTGAEDLVTPPRLERARALHQSGLCAGCVGRVSARVGHGFSDLERGRVQLEAAGVGGRAADGCPWCQGLLRVEELDRYAILVGQALADWEHENLLMGVKLDPDRRAAEDGIREKFGLDEGEGLHTELSREIGKRVSEATGKPVDFRRPQVTAILDLRFDHVAVEVAPAFVYGRYRKFARDIPQTRWPCNRCRGRGCDHCARTGQMYRASVEALVGEAVVAMFGADGYTLHGAGREDIDARCLGRGRPFVLELSRPRARTVDLAEARRRINGAAAPDAEVSALRFVGRDEVERVKEHRGRKRYEAVVQLDQVLDHPTVLKGVLGLRGIRVAQRTPSRVAHRRSDHVRPRTVHDAALLGFEKDRARIALACDAGLYVKELVSGDEGRTEPSLTQMLGVPARVVELDVVDVEGPDPEEDPW